VVEEMAYIEVFNTGSTVLNRNKWLMSSLKPKKTTLPSWVPSRSASEPYRKKPSQGHGLAYWQSTRVRTPEENPQVSWLLG
jgi:hypothetical protein